MNGPDLEARLRTYYATLTPQDSARLVPASRATLDEARRPQALRPKRVLWAVLNVAATVAVAVALLAVLVLPRWGSPVNPVAAPSFDPAAVDKASVDAAGLMRNGGIWVSAGAYIMTSTDNGASWRAMARPIDNSYDFMSPFVLDSEHAWMVGRGGSADSPAGQMPLARTDDGGRTWLYATVSAPQDCATHILSFEDANHGFMVCMSDAARAVLRTTDGGANWEVMSRPSDLGRSFTASDAATLWSARDAADQSTGPDDDRIVVKVSRDAGATWSTVELPELASITGAKARYYPKALVAGGPTFADATHGAIAIVDLRDPSDSSLWIYTTADAGRTWTLNKKSVRGPRRTAVLGRVWAIVSEPTTPELTTSLDSGATWTEVPGVGLTGFSGYRWIDFTDRDHAAALVTYNPGDDYTRIGPLMLSSDGGRTWHPADFGVARAAVPADATLDPDAAEYVANSYENLVRQSWTATRQNPLLKQGAWKLLSPYSQRAFGSYADFVLAEPSLSFNGDVGHAQHSPEALSEQNLGSDLWRELTANANMTRAYVVEVPFPNTSVATDTLVVAPLATTGEWRIWVKR